MRTMARSAVFVVVVSAAFALSSCDRTSSPSRLENPTAPSSSSSARAPSVSGITVLPGRLGLASVTEFTFQPAGVSNPSGGTVNFSWDVGDGVYTGQTVRHIYQFANTYGVRMIASNQWGSSQPVQSSIEVKDLTGEWGGRWLGNVSITLFLVQAGTNVSGTALEPDGYRGTVSTISLDDARFVMRIELALDSNPNITRWYTVNATFINGYNGMTGSTVSGTQGFDVVRK